METNYSKEIVTAIAKFFIEEGYNFDLDEDNRKFKISFGLRGKIKTCLCRIAVDESDFTVYAYPLLGSDDKDELLMQCMAEFVCRANYGVKRGFLELDMRDGELRYKVFVDCNGSLPSRRIIADSIIGACTMVDFLSEGILAVLFQEKSAKEAIELCVEKFLADSEKTAKH